MKHRNVMAVIFLSIFTLGIYDLVWLVKVKKELNAKTSVHTPTLWLLFAPILLLIVGMIVAILTTSPSTATAEDVQTTANIVTMIVYLISLVVIVPITFYWFFKFSKAVGQYTHGQMSTAMTFILLYLLRFIGIAVIQDHFNDMLAGAGTPGVAPAVPGMGSDGTAVNGWQPAGTSVAPAPAPADGQNVGVPQPPTVQGVGDNQSSGQQTPPSNPTVS